MRTTKQLIRRVTLGTAVLAIAFTSMAARPGVAQAAHGAGTPYQSSVNCDSMGGLMQVQSFAAAAPGLTSQVIAYQYWISDETHKTPVIGYSPSGFGYFTHTRSTSSGAYTWTESPTDGRSGVMSIVLPPAAYSVWTKHWFWTGTSYVEGSWVRTASYNNINSGHTSYCLL